MAWCAYDRVLHDTRAQLQEHILLSDVQLAAKGERGRGKNPTVDGSCTRYGVRGVSCSELVAIHPANLYGWDLRKSLKNSHGNQVDHFCISF